MSHRRPAPVMRLAMLLTVLGGPGLVACSTGSATAPSSSPSDGSPTASAGASTVASVGSTVIAPSVTGTPSPTASAPSPSPAVSTSVASGQPGYRVTFRRTATTVGAAKLESVYPQVVVAGGADAATRVRVQKLLGDRVAAARRSFLEVADSPEATITPDGAPASEQEIDVLHESRYGSLYTVQFSDYTYTSGAAHPITNLFSVTVDWRTGKQVRIGDLFTDLRPVDRAVRAALVRKGIDAEGAASVTVGPQTTTATSVDSAPTSAGLWVGISHCILTCAYGPVEVTVPWSKLPKPRAQVLP